jgi:hypothetical protein
MPDPRAMPDRPAPTPRRADRYAALLHGALIVALVLFKLVLLAAFVLMAR